MSPRVKKRRKCRKYKILIGSQVFFFLFIHDLLFSPEHQLESEGRFVNLSGNFSPLCAGWRQSQLKQGSENSMSVLLLNPAKYPQSISYNLLDFLLQDVFSHSFYVHVHFCRRKQRSEICQSKINSRSVAGPMGQMNLQPSVWCSKYYFFSWFLAEFFAKILSIYLFIFLKK